MLPTPPGSKNNASWKPEPLNFCNLNCLQRKQWISAACHRVWACASCQVTLLTQTEQCIQCVSLWMRACSLFPPESHRAQAPDPEVKMKDTQSLYHNLSSNTAGQVHICVSWNNIWSQTQLSVLRAEMCPNINTICDCFHLTLMPVALLWQLS